MKALTLIQPWATLIVIGAKRVETRSWYTGYRGPVAIHAGQARPDVAKFLTEQDPIIAPLLAQHGYTFDNLPRGGIVATAEIYDVCRFASPEEPFTGPRVINPQVALKPTELACGDFTPGRFGFGLKNVVALPELVTCRGLLNLWEVPDRLLPLLQPQPAH